MKKNAGNLVYLAEHYNDEDAARKFLENLRWPNGIACVHCGSTKAYRLRPRADSKKPGRKGLIKCGDCKKQFTVTVKSIFEDSHIPLHKWVYGIHLLCSSKKGMSAHQLHRELGVSYESAWFMAHRIRFAMAQSPFAEKLNGVVEVDEVYIGPRRPRLGTSKRGRGTSKMPVIGLVQRGGDVRAYPIEQGTARKLKEYIRENVSKEATIMTDEYLAYRGLNKEFADHQTIMHHKNEYVRGDTYTNTIEGFFGILKRGISGVYQHVSRQHLPKYLGEFEFRYNGRKISDGERTIRAIQGFEGKRLMYKDSRTSAS
jgi:transposase-like protein